MLTTLLRCPRCGGQVYFQGGSGVHPDAYVCRAYHEHGRAGCAAGTKVREDLLVALVRPEVARLLAGIAPALVRYLEEERADDHRAALLASLREQVAQVRRDRAEVRAAWNDRSHKLWALAVIRDEAELRDYARELADKQERLEAQLEREGREDAPDRDAALAGLARAAVSGDLSGLFAHLDARGPYAGAATLRVLLGRVHFDYRPVGRGRPVEVWLDPARPVEPSAWVADILRTSSEAVVM